jgi:hypothetical protein
MITSPWAFLTKTAASVLGPLFGGQRRQTERACIKLIHADELRQWRKFPRCQEAVGISYGEYLEQRRRLQELRRSVQLLLNERERLQDIDSDRVVEYHAERLRVRRSLLPRRPRIPLPHAQLPAGCQKSAWPVSCGNVRSWGSAEGHHDDPCPCACSTSSSPGSAAG